MAKTRIAFVGVGGMGQCAHLRNYVTVPDCEVIAISELREELGKKVQARYAIPKFYKDYREMLAAEKPDGIVAIQGFDIHGTLIPELFDYGVPVITEKPIASSVETGQRIVNSLEKSKAKYYVAYHKRSDPATMFAKKQMQAWQQSGEMGAMRYVRITMPPGDWVGGGFTHLLGSDEKVPPIPRDPKPDHMDQKAFDKYVSLVNYYIHQVNLMRHLLGDYEVKYADKAGLTMTVEGSNGVTGLLEMQPFSTSTDWQEVALVCFERGWIRIDLPAPMAIDRPGRVVVYSDPKGGQEMESSPTLPWVHAMRQQAFNFIKAIRGEETPLCDAKDALKDLVSMKQYLDLYLKNGGVVA